MSSPTGAAFVIVVGDGSAGRRLRGSSGLGPGRPADEQVHWDSEGGRVHVVGWSTSEPGMPGVHWHVSEHGIAVVVGQVRWRGRGYTSPEEWCRELCDAATTQDLDTLREQMIGVFAACYVSRQGVGWVATDLLGMRCVYTASSPEGTVVASTARLAADAAGLLGRRRERVGRSVTWTALTGHHFGLDTGLDGVSTLAPGATLVLDPRGATPTGSDRVWPPASDDGPLDLDACAEVARAGVLDELEAALSLSDDPPAIRLTGGRDSRLVLGVALSAGIADRFRYETVGPSELADVRVASDLARRFELRHEVRFMEGPPTEAYVDRARSFVDLTAGMVNLWDIDDPRVTGAVYVTGIGGEVWRRGFGAAQRPRTVTGLERLFRPERFNLLGLVRPELAADMHRQLIDDLTTAWGLVDPLDLLHAHYCRHRFRFSRLGPRQELDGDLHLQPLYDPAALRSALAVPGPMRHDEALARRVLEITVPELVDLPFAGPSWAAAPSARPDVTGPAEPEVTVPAAPKVAGTAHPQRKSETLMASVGRTLTPDRAELFSSLVDDVDNPAWENLDRAAVQAAVDGYASLSNGQRRELFGAATQVLWMRRS